MGMRSLQMGEIGLPIYAYKDKYSDNLLRLVLTPNSRTAAAGGHLYLDLIEETGCMSISIFLCGLN